MTTHEQLYKEARNFDHIINATGKPDEIKHWGIFIIELQTMADIETHNELDYSRTRLKVLENIIHKAMDAIGY